MSKSKIFTWICIFFAAGIWLASRFNLPRQSIYISFTLFIIAFALLFYLQNYNFALGAIFLCVAALGALRLQSAQVASEFDYIYGSKQKLEGYVIEDPDIRTSKQLITIRLKGFSQNILATLPLSQSFFYGDWIVLEGKIMQPQNFSKKNSDQDISGGQDSSFGNALSGWFLTSDSEFDYQKYLERFNVYATVNYPKVLILKSHQLNWLKEFLLKIKYNFARRIDQFLAATQASLLMGILIGARKTLPQNIIDNFNITGVSHVIAISGYNISVIIKALEYLAKFLGRKISLYLSLLVIFGFVILSGASASVIRAAVMGSLLLIAFSIGRQYSITPALFFSAAVMLFINPKILFWDISFQLSFAATFGIICFCPLLEKLTQNWPSLWQIKGILITTMAAIISTLPLILFYFGRLSVVAPLVNILILPLVPVTMLLGFLIVIPFFGSGFAFLSNFLLVYMLKVTEIFAKPVFSSLTVNISQWTFLVLIAVVFWLYFWLKNLSQKKAA